MSNTHQATILSILYEAGFHFTLTTNKITVQDVYSPDKEEKIVFLFNAESEDLISIDNIPLKDE